MRRALVPLLLVAALALTLPAAATTELANYKDKFTSIGWGGSNGSLPWSGPWHEIGDDGDEKKGSVRVVSSGNCPSGNCISISALLTNIGARRTADLSVLEVPELCFDLVNIPASFDLGVSQLLVQVNPGSGWVTLDGGVYDLGEEIVTHPTFDLSEFRSEVLEVRFLVVGLAMTAEVFIDNVEISGSPIETPTTTTTVPDKTSTTVGGTSTTTTEPRSSTTTTVPATTTTEDRAVSPPTMIGPDNSTTTTTTSGEDTTSTLVAGGGGDEFPPGSGGAGDGSGIRWTARGLQADFDGGLFSDVGAVSPITGVDFQARFSLAAEVIEASWVWMVLLALVIAWSIVSGMERRRSRLLD
ncbi:MAG TPA: hypothetical protein VI980_09980 [Acidimicrobiia bacterium]|nr:hypothetical protein [Acidimicrobiia bacterium]